MSRVLGTLVALAGLWLAISLFAPSGAGDAAVAFASSRDCRECHAAVFAEWEESQHAMSWTNPAVRLLSNDFANQDCIDCHAPSPVFVTGIGERVLPRTTRRVEGVDCIACHQLPAHPDGSPGGMAGGVRNDGVPCRPEERRELVRPEFCAGCHNQHQTVDQWAASSFATDDAERQDCLDCHMPWVETPAGTRHRSHLFPGGDDLAMLERAVELSGAARDGGWVVTLDNVGAGHSFPTDERSRAADLFWRPLAGAGSEPEAWRHLHRLRSPYRSEVDVPDTLLKADERRDVPVVDADGAPVPTDAAIEVALFYKRSPYWADPAAPDPDREATLVHRLELRP